ncbi:MAG: hypothetical protein U1E65_20075 [Myxococcota bacterium]
MTLIGIVKRYVLLLGLGLGLAAPAFAQNPPAATRRPGRQIRIGEFKIEGQIQKPQAFYILQRSNLNFEGLELKNSFVPKIINSVDQAPF